MVTFAGETVLCRLLWEAQHRFSFCAWPSTLSRFVPPRVLSLSLCFAVAGPLNPGLQCCWKEERKKSHLLSWENLLGMRRLSPPTHCHCQRPVTIYAVSLSMHCPIYALYHLQRATTYVLRLPLHLHCVHLYCVRCHYVHLHCVQCHYVHLQCVHCHCVHLHGVHNITVCTCAVYAVTMCTCTAYAVTMRTSAA